VPDPAARPPAARVAPPVERRGHAAFWAALAIVVIGAGVAAAILLSNGGGGESTTVLVGAGSSVARGAASTGGDTTEAPPPAGSIEAGRYVQAGSFKTFAHAEAERERLAQAGVDTQVVSSDGVEQLYPGFHVLLAGPLSSGAEEASIVRSLHRNGVPSAFARPVSPAATLSGAGEAAGSWSGRLDRSSAERPGLDGSLPVRLEMDSGGERGVLDVEGGDCLDQLTLSRTEATTLAYSQGHPCLGGGEILLRPGADQLMLTLLPPGTDTLILGSLSPA
jgi:hypothetical protein